MPTSTHNQPVAISPVTTQESRPVPDPTTLTSQQLYRAIDDIKELIQSKIDDNEKLNDEKFRGIQTQFTERDTRLTQSSQDNKENIRIALEGQKESVAKSEIGYKEQINSTVASIASLTKTLDDKISGVNQLIASDEKGVDARITALEKRFDLSEGRSKGIGDGWGFLVGGIGALGVIGMLVALVLKG